MSALEITGHEARRGEEPFGMGVFRLRGAIDRAGLARALNRLVPVMPPVGDQLLATLDQGFTSAQILAVPWTVPDAGEVAAQRRHLEEIAGELGIERVWFFQSSTQLTKTMEELEEEEDEDEEDDDEEEEDDDEEEESAKWWSNGLPPMTKTVPFPVDGYPAIIEELDWYDFGVAVKMRGAFMPGMELVLHMLHSFWLHPHAGQYRNADVTVDRRHNTAHFWVDRFTTLLSSEGQVHQLLWVMTCLHQIVPVVHATFSGASMSQKYGGLMGDTSEPFVMGGNPLLAIHASGGMAAVDRWIEEQQDWSTEEVARMLREVAIEVVTARPEKSGGEEEEEDEEEDEDEEEEDAEEEKQADEEAPDLKRYIATYADELLLVRARAGKLHARATDVMRPVLEVSEKYEHRRRRVSQIVGTLRDRGSVMALIRIVDQNPIKDSLDSIGKEDLLVAVARALGEIADPAAVPALCRLVAAKGRHNDEPRAPAAEALATCLASSPPPREIPETVVEGLLFTIAERNDGPENAACHLAYGLLARQVEVARARAMREKLVATTSARDDDLGTLARRVAIMLCGGEKADVTADVAAMLGSGGYSHKYTVERMRIALRIAALFPGMAPPEVLVPLTRFDEPDVRTSAHELLAAGGKPLARAPVYDRTSAARLTDAELIAAIGEAHVVGRGALVREAGVRKLAAATPAIIAAARAVVGRADRGNELMDFDSAVLEHAVHALVRPPIDDATAALFDELLRHPNYHVKWALMKRAPNDERLIPGMFHVLGEKWGWQESTAKAWLDKWRGTPAYEAARRK